MSAAGVNGRAIPAIVDSVNTTGIEACARKRILIVEDDEAQARPMQRLLERDPQFAVTAVRDGQQALECLQTADYALVLTDLRMSEVDGMQLIRQVRENRLPVTVIVITGYGSIDQAVEAMRLGAYDFLPKPVDAAKLLLTVQRALRDRVLQDELIELRARVRHGQAFHGVLSKNPRMVGLFELISNAAGRSTTMLIEGETGTGKEQLARAIHQASQPRRGPLVAVNCAALPETLLESELFGHEKGAFTGALGERPGRFELADGGTLFLDEIGDVPPTMQAKLLRVLQERRFERVGGSDMIEVDLRVVAATNRPLEALVKQGKFREDLYYRLNVVRLELPPLREQLEDIPLLARHFAEKHRLADQPAKSISPEAMESLMRHSWPGNIRELENAIERASIIATEPTIQPHDLPLEVTELSPARTPHAFDLRRPLPDVLREIVSDIESRYILAALQKTGGKVSECARLCGLSRRSISAKLTEYGMRACCHASKTAAVPAG